MRNIFSAIAKSWKVLLFLVLIFACCGNPFLDAKNMYSAGKVSISGKDSNGNYVTDDLYNIVFTDSEGNPHDFKMVSLDQYATDEVDLTAPKEAFTVTSVDYPNCVLDVAVRRMNVRYVRLTVSYAPDFNNDDTCPGEFTPTPTPTPTLTLTPTPEVTPTP